MSGQEALFGAEEQEAEQGPGKYTTNVKSPIYEPKNRCPDIRALTDNFKSSKLLAEILASNVGEDEKAFLCRAAHRHTVFHYGRIADYYAHASPAMQNLMEKSALVIVDFNKAIENGFVQLTDEVVGQFQAENPEEADAEA